MVATPRDHRPGRWIAGAVVLGVLCTTAVFVEAALVAHLDAPVAEPATRIYARPPVLRLGTRPDPNDVRAHLERQGYVPAADRSPDEGEYALGSRTWLIGRRPFRHGAALGQAGTLIVRLGHRGHIVSLADESGRRYTAVVLEPELIGRIGSGAGDRNPVRLEEIPEQLTSAVLAVEDHRFFEHRGVDLHRIAGALLANLRAGRLVQGGSTLSQQLAKNLYLSPRRSWWRKMREAAMAIVLERRYSKRRILEAYLNEVYLGHYGGTAIHGVDLASRLYFGKSVSGISLSEAALLAGIIRAPNLYSPARHPEAARRRRDLVLRLMAERGVISSERSRETARTPVPTPPAFAPRPAARYFLDHISAHLRHTPAVPALRGHGLAVFSSLDSRLQRAATAAVRQGLQELESAHPALVRPDSPLQAALVAMDPHSGEILAMVGGRDYGRSQFNRATRARRQPGSAFKPVVALAALSRRGVAGPRFTLASLLDDERLVVESAAGSWEPANYDGRFRGVVTLREALERSLNVPFARLGLALGPGRIVETARSLGIEGRLQPVPSLAIGASEVTLLDLTRAYGVLAAGGFRANLHPTLAVLDRNGNLVRQAEPGGEQVFDPREAYLVTSALLGAVERGTGRPLRARGYRGEVAAKSGTTNAFRDGWFVGYTPRLAVGVWVGFDDGRSMGLPGARVALPIFSRILIAAVGRDGDARFSRPRGLEIAEIDPSTGLLAGWGCRGRPEVFLPGTAPRTRCAPYRALGSRFPDRARADGLALDLYRELQRLRRESRR